MEAPVTEASAYSKLLDSLPTELWYDILERSVVDFDGVGRLQAVRNVTHVNRAIREIAISDKALWTYIIISPTLPEEVCETFISRSGNLPLEVYIFFDPNQNMGLSGIPGGEEVAREVARWASVKVLPAEGLHVAFRAGHFRGPSCGVVNTLETLDSSILTSYEVDSTDAFLPQDSVAAATLEKVRLWDCKLCHPISVRFGSLKELSVQLTDGVAFLPSVLHQAPNLEDLYIHLIGPPPIYPPHPLPLTRLHTLSLTGRGLIACRDFLARLDLPSLKSLTLGTRGVMALRTPEVRWKYNCEKLFGQIISFTWAGAVDINGDASKLRWPPEGRSSFYADAIENLKNATHHTLADPTPVSLSTLRMLAVKQALNVLPELKELTVPCRVPRLSDQDALIILTQFLELRKNAGLPSLVKLGIHVGITGVPKCLDWLLDEGRGVLAARPEQIKLLQSMVEHLEIVGEKSEEDYYTLEDFDQAKATTMDTTEHSEDCDTVPTD